MMPLYPLLKLSKSAIAAALLCLCVKIYANTEEAELKAKFVANFAKFVEWLDTPPLQAGLTFCLYGVERHRNVFQTTIESQIIKKAHPTVVIHTFDEQATNCNVAYIGALSDPQRRYLQQQLIAKSILTVGESTDFIKDGGIIRLFAQNGKLRFEINPSAAKASRIKVSSRLLKLARITDTEAAKASE